MNGDGDPTKSSATALGNLVMACLANTERDRGLATVDPIAPDLLRWNDGWAAAARLNFLHPAIRLASERFMPGIYGFALARMKHMDLIVRQEVAATIDTLVILGAGYDTRAYRMRRELSGIQVFEVDRPATSRDKRKRLAKDLRSMPENIDFVEADLAQHDLIDKLASRGHRLSSRTLFLLSGVSMYLPEAAMLDLFDQVATHSSQRTSLVFDYIDPSVLVEPKRYYGNEWVKYATKLGEKPVWGIRAGGTSELLTSHGLQLASNLNADELTASYLRRADGAAAARPFQFGAIAHAFAGEASGSERGD